MYSLSFLVISAFLTREISSFPNNKDLTKQTQSNNRDGNLTEVDLNNEHRKDVANGIIYKNGESGIIINGRESHRDLEKNKGQDNQWASGDGHYSNEFLKKDTTDSIFQIENKKVASIKNNLEDVFKNLNIKPNALQINIFTGPISKLFVGDSTKQNKKLLESFFNKIEPYILLKNNLM